MRDNAGTNAGTIQRLASLPADQVGQLHTNCHFRSLVFRQFEILAMSENCVHNDPGVFGNRKLWQVRIHSSFKQQRNLSHAGCIGSVQEFSRTSVIQLELWLVIVVNQIEVAIGS